MGFFDFLKFNENKFLSKINSYSAVQNKTWAESEYADISYATDAFDEIDFILKHAPKTFTPTQLNDLIAKYKIDKYQSLYKEDKEKLKDYRSKNKLLFESITVTDYKDAETTLNNMDNALICRLLKFVNRNNKIFDIDSPQVDSSDLIIVAYLDEIQETVGVLLASNPKSEIHKIKALYITEDNRGYGFGRYVLDSFLTSTKISQYHCDMPRLLDSYLRNRAIPSKDGFIYTNDPESVNTFYENLKVECSENNKTIPSLKDFFE
ncbi:hypothetical protein [Candidatus Epulonipiscium viviparus]|uniref:hypothetical protein n=1 Tax=Candidatus Epulonipiscium viviparus TaxID=420336 RepID=UPI0027380D39|nr:hypothetical protein [Candidatus Epulopiscium viviparus]